VETVLRHVYAATGTSKHRGEDEYVERCDDDDKPALQQKTNDRKESPRSERETGDSSIGTGRWAFARLNVASRTHKNQDASRIMAGLALP